MRVAFLTREYPPEVYGGAGVHVEYLSQALARQPDVHVSVHAFGDPRPSPLVAGTYQPWDALPTSPPGQALRTISVDLEMAAAIEDADLAHSHTWYANLAGHLGRLMWDMPHVMTAHSLEPLRPWKAEQLGGGYALSSWCERTAIESADAVIAVSSSMAEDILRAYPNVDPDIVSVIYNGIDQTDYHPDAGTDVLERLGIDPDAPAVMCIGRITAQKGLEHLLAAGQYIDGGAQLIFCAGAADTTQIAERIRARARGLASERRGVHWIEDPISRPEIVQLLSHSDVFVCPSVYEPFGLINVEAMACSVPVVASAVGGIPEIVVDGVTGVLVPIFDAGPDGQPADPDRFARDLAAATNELLANPARAREMGAAGLRRVQET
ncbi:MAG: glycogen synthase, partial [Acidimicrobiaceae bacterium]|nr:glycogen synthase [Acidimicrobiaceae bacterium]